MKNLAFGLLALLVLFFVVYAVDYRQTAVPIQALSLVKNGRVLYVPQSLWSCNDKGVCTARLNGGALHIETTFQPAGSPFGQCRARYDTHSLPCTIRQHYYYRFGETMRPYLVLHDDAGILPLKAWQVARFRAEAILASLALGEESVWTLVIGVVALAGSGFAFRYVHQACIRHLRLATGGSYQKHLLVLASLVVSTVLAGAIWIIALFFLFATGVMLD